MAIYNGNQKVSLSGISAIYVGSQKVYQKITRVLTGITLSGYTTRLAQNAAFSYGGTVTANYSDGSTENVTSSATYSGYDMANAGYYTVTVSYSEDGLSFSSSYSLTVYGYKTVFSGYSGVSWNLSSSSVPSDLTVYTDSSLNAQGKYRITYTLSVPEPSYGFTRTYYVNNTSVTTAPTDPVVSDFSTYDRLNIVGGTLSTGSGTNAITRSIKLKFDNTNKSFIVDVYSFGTRSLNGTMSLYVTKIEYVVE